MTYKTHGKGLIKDFDIECTPETKENLITHMGMVHDMVVNVCDEYHSVMRRQIYQTPKSYLSFIAAYKAMYTHKLGALKEKESRVKLGLDKLVQGAQDVEAMKVVLAKEQVKLEEATLSLCNLPIYGPITLSSVHTINGS